MFETKTYEALLQEKLATISSALDRREGSIIFDAMAPNSLESAMIYVALDSILNETFADTASRDYLILRSAERGIIPYPATAAIGIGLFNIDVPLGSRFSNNRFNWSVTERIGPGQYYLTSETKGADPNRFTGTLVPIQYLDGLTTAELNRIVINGEDEEATEVLRLRYINSFHNQSYGFNRAQYIEVVGALPDVGGVKPYRAWNGPGTVKVVITNSAYDVPTPELINSVQTTIDPTQNSGDGLGLASIDHEVTIEGVTANAINITSTLSYASGWSIEECLPLIEQALDDYFNEVNATWADNETLIIRISQIETRLLNVAGIIDITGTRINGEAQNLELAGNEIAARGDFTDV